VSRLAVVFDTNILFSATAWRGAPFRCLELARGGKLEGITCQPILDELADKLTAKLHFSVEQANEALADLLGFMRVAEITGTLRAVAADPDDDKVVECAVAAGATHIVTGDRRHLLPLGEHQGILIVDAARLVALAEGEPEADEEAPGRDAA